ncbi:MAG: hypothetical protein EOQ33_20675 [Mesorhizobium sp.]|nr:MAG: hypothetical protein EOQ33_20675 [Mesorhizobium sp.]
MACRLCQQRHHDHAGPTVSGRSCPDPFGAGISCFCRPCGLCSFALQRRASVRTRKGRCRTLIWRMIPSENRFRFSGSCAR